ncbi:MAG TPA: cytochrome b/b6 domain-containing protein [Spirochaetota bacterium]|nr:cytochrome b/b6 domain-containing protein [Spirochaetota bacterium]
MIKKIYMYKRFERFWHWAQALLIFFLALTGFEVHGSYEIFGFKNAVVLHMYAGFMLIILIAFAIFWHFTTGEWRQYIPKTDKLRDQVRFYLVGIFKNEPHPVEKTAEVKLNPLQRLTYLGYKILIIPVMVTTGLVYYYVAHGGIHLQSVKWIAILHTLGAFGLLSFTVIHVYMTTTGPRLTSHIKAMFTGYDEVEVKDK